MGFCSGIQPCVIKQGTKYKDCCMTDVRLIYGSVVDSCSESWRFECECRYVANLPSRDDRKRALTGIAKSRGQSAAADVESFVRTNFKLLRG